MSADYKVLILRIIEQIDEQYLPIIYHFVKKFIKKD